jgi:hypothetical protein
MQLRLLIIIIYFSTGVYLFSQNDNLPDIIIPIAEELSSNETDPEASTIIIERLLDLTENPVNINSADESEIARIFFLTEFQVKVLCDYVKSEGKITTLYEIAYLPGFDNTTAMMIKPFIVFDAAGSFRSAPVRIKQTIMSNLIYKSGPENTKPDITSLKLLTKYKVAAGKITAGFTGEKDAGEQSFFLTGKTPDFLSAYCTYEGTRLVRRLIVGDYSVRFGQGTNISSGILSGLSLTAPDYMAGKNEISQYSSTDENNFFRGAAAAFNLNLVDVFIFYSRNKIDASLNYNEDSVAFSVKSIYKSGLHETASDLLKKDVLTEISAGGNINLNLNSLRVGLTWSENRFSLPLVNESIELKDLNSFTGSRNSLWSGDYKWLFKNIIFFGEYTLNPNRGTGFLQGIKLRPDNRLTLNFLFRQYGQKFRTLHGNAPGSGSQTNGGTGVMASFIYEAGRNFFISAGTDFQSYRWLKYRCDAPSWGKKYELKAGYYPSDILSVEAYYNLRYYMNNTNESIQLNKPSLINDRSVKTIINWTPEPGVNLGTRIEYKVLTPTGEKGMALSQDINYLFKRIPVRIWFRWCFFDTNNYDSRIYIYENDLVYSFSIPAFYDEGSRSYLMIAWKIKKIAELRFKYGITTTDLSNGKTSDREDFKFQIRISV